jgi:hypothetical protein
MLQLKHTFEVTYFLNGAEHTLVILCDNFGHAQEKVAKAYKGASIVAIVYAGPVAT